MISFGGFLEECLPCFVRDYLGLYSVKVISTETKSAQGQVKMRSNQKVEENRPALELNFT